MFGASRLRLFLPVVLSLSMAGMGCKGGSSSPFARRDKSDDAVQVPGPELASPNGSSRNYRGHSSNTEVTALRSGSPAFPAREPQRTCPVSGQQLGVSGAPTAVMVRGEPVFVCSPSCAKKLQQNPDKYLAKVHAETRPR